MSGVKCLDLQTLPSVPLAPLEPPGSLRARVLALAAPSCLRECVPVGVWARTRAREFFLMHVHLV